MAEATKYSFKMKDIVAALLKAQNIHEGRWTLQLEFSHAAFFTGPSPEKARQAVGISVNGAQLSKVDDGDTTLPPGVIYSAEQLNPVSGNAPALTARKRQRISRTQEASED